MSNFISVNNISNLHKQIKKNVDILNIFKNDEESVKYLINIMSNIYNSNSFMSNIHILNDNALEEYVNNLLPNEEPPENNLLLNEEPLENKSIEVNKPSEKISKNIQILVESKDLDKFNKNNYIYKLPNEINNIQSIELESAKIPKTQYLINDNNNKIFFQETNQQVNNNTFYIAIIENGNYTINDLKTEIEDSMNIIGNSKYTISINKNNHKISINSNLQGGDKIFNIKFQLNILGFNSNHLYKNKNKYISESMYNLDDSNILYLYINNEKFTTLFLECEKNKNYFYNKNKYTSKIIFNTNLDKLDSFHIIFKDESNNEYNFNNFNHTLLFNIEYLET